MTGSKTITRFNSIIEKLNITDTEVAKNLNFALESFEESLGEDNIGAIAYVAERIYARKENNIQHPTIGFVIPPQDLDFVFGQPVFTGTPHLLLKVPALQSGEEPIIQGAKDWPAEKDKLDYGDSLLPRGSVLVYPNREGDQDDVNDRPIVHWSGVRPGEYVIVGGISYDDEELVFQVIKHELGKPPEGFTIWDHYRESATVANLSHILDHLRGHGFGALIIGSATLCFSRWPIQ